MIFKNVYDAIKIDIIDLIRESDDEPFYRGLFDYFGVINQLNPKLNYDDFESVAERLHCDFIDDVEFDGEGYDANYTRGCLRVLALLWKKYGELTAVNKSDQIVDGGKEYLHKITIQ